MRLLVIGTEVRERGEIQNYSGVWSFYLTRELRSRGVEVVFSDLPTSRRSQYLTDLQLINAYQGVDLGGADHVIALGNRYFDRMPIACCQALRAKCAGAVTQLHDSQLVGKPVDCTFSVRAIGKRRGNHYVGWAADPELCKPDQDPSELRILVDHADYVRRAGSERIAEVMRDVSHFVQSRAWAPRFAAVRVRQIADGGAVDCDFAPRRFTRQHVPFEEACREYSKAHMFMVTHPESVGLTVLETAMCGALPLVPEGFVAPDRLKTVRCVVYQDRVNWRAALEAIDIAASRAKAIENSWSKVADRMLKFLERFQKC